MTASSLTKRLAAVFSAALMALVWAGPATADDKVVMNLGWATPLDSDYGVLAKKFKELAEDYSGGSIEVKLRCCAQIGTEDDAFKALQLGTVDGYFITQNNVSPHWPLMNVFVLPYIFQNKEHLQKVTQGAVGDEIRGSLAVGMQADIVVFEAERIASRCTIEAPRRYATGIAHVLVNGRPVIRDGQRLDENPGQVLRLSS